MNIECRDCGYDGTLYLHDGEWFCDDCAPQSGMAEHGERAPLGSVPIGPLCDEDAR